MGVPLAYSLWYIIDPVFSILSQRRDVIVSTALVVLAFQLRLMYDVWQLLQQRTRLAFHAYVLGHYVSLALPCEKKGPSVHVACGMCHWPCLSATAVKNDVFLLFSFLLLLSVQNECLSIILGN